MSKNTTNIPFGLYRMDKKMLEKMAEPEVQKETGIRCYPEFNLYCGPVMQVPDYEDNPVDCFIPIIEPDIEIPGYSKGETWRTQLEMSKNGIIGGYDFCTIMPCYEIFLTPATDVSPKEQEIFDYFLENETDLKDLALTVYINFLSVEDDEDI